MSEFYILKGREIEPVANLEEWAKAFELSNRQIGSTQIGDVRISTVFLGVDHNHLHDGPPLLFETMIFGGAHDQEQWRCSTYAQAEAQHEDACALVRGKPN